MDRISKDRRNIMMYSFRLHLAIQCIGIMSNSW
uniref:Uncharacterized protein n=1 Tax=Lepeophtheirus salmonis TaxID=72036 RepID=A0A0K2TJI6_LEPSM